MSFVTQAKLEEERRAAVAAREAARAHAKAVAQQREAARQQQASQLRERVTARLKQAAERRRVQQPKSVHLTNMCAPHLQSPTAPCMCVTLPTPASRTSLHVC